MSSTTDTPTKPRRGNGITTPSRRGGSGRILTDVLVDLELYRVDPDAAKLVTPAAIRRYQAVPVSFVGDRTLLVAMVDPANVLAIDDIAVMTGYEVRPAVASLQDVEWLLTRLEDPNFGVGATAPEEYEDDPEADQSPAAAEARPPA